MAAIPRLARPASAAFCLLVLAAPALAGTPSELHGTLTAHTDVPPEAGALLRSELRTGFTSNADKAEGGRASPMVELRQAFETAQPLGEATFRFALRGSLAEPLDAPEARKAGLAGEAGLSAPLGHGLLASAGIVLEYEDDQGLRTSDLGFHVELGLDEGPLRPYAALTANRLDYGPEPLALDLVLPNEGRAHARYGAETGIVLAPVPGIEARLAGGALTWDYRLDADDFGFVRNSAAPFLRAGLGMEGPRFSASLDARLLRRSYDDPDFTDETVLLVDAAAAYTLDEETRLALAIVSELEETGIPFASGKTVTYGELGLTRRLGPMNAVRAALFAERERFLQTERADLVRGALLAFEHRLTDTLLVDLRAEYDRTTSPLLGADFDTFRVSAGLTYAFAPGGTL